MTKTHAARQLLALGPLTFGQFAEITGWPVGICRRVLSYLVDDKGEAERLGRLYRLTHGSQMPDVHPLEAQGQPAHGKAPHGAVRAGAGVEFSAAESDVRQAQACGCRCGRCSCSMGKGGVK